MILEFLQDGSSDRSLLRLFDFSPAEACELQRACVDLAGGARRQFDTATLPVMAVNHCQLMLLAGERDLGVLNNGNNRFECVLTPETWDNVAGLVEPFCTSTSPGFQWLWGGWEQSGISLLLSNTGEW